MERRIITLGVLVSGNGSNLQAIIDRIETGTLDARIAVVISDNPRAFALERAAGHGIPVVTVPTGAYPSREAADAALVGVLNDISEQHSMTTPTGMMRLCERWSRTRDDELGRKLRAAGVLVAASKKGDQS